MPYVSEKIGFNPITVEIFWYFVKFTVKFTIYNLQYKVYNLRTYSCVMDQIIQKD